MEKWKRSSQWLNLRKLRYIHTYIQNVQNTLEQQGWNEVFSSRLSLKRYKLCIPVNKVLLLWTFIVLISCIYAYDYVAFHF
jgi:hypothetical protein